MCVTEIGPLTVSNLGFQFNQGNVAVNVGGQFPIGMLNILQQQQQHAQPVMGGQEMSKFIITDESGQQRLITLPSKMTFVVQNRPPGSYFLANTSCIGGTGYEVNSLQNKVGVTNEMKTDGNITNEKENTDNAKTEKTEQDIENEKDKVDSVKGDAGDDNKRDRSFKKRRGKS